MAGGFFSGGSSDSVNASVAEAEAAAREAEAARDEIDNKFVEFAGQIEEGDYTVPNADDTLTTKFLRQDGTWVIPAENGGADVLNDLTDVTVASPAADQFLQYNGTQWVNVAVDPADPLTAGTGLEIISNVVSVQDAGIGTNQLANNAITSAKIVDGGVMRADIADNAINDGKLDATNTGTAGQILSATGTGNFTWVAADGNTAYTASEGLTLVGDDFQIASDGVTTVKVIDDAITSAKILDDNVTADELNVTGDGTSGQILSSDGDGSFTWIDNDGGTDTTYTAGTGLDLTGTVFSVADQGIDTTQIAGEAVGEGQLNSTNSPTEVGQLLSANLDGTFTWVAADGNTAYTAGTGLTLASDEFSITVGGVTATEIADNTVGADELNVTGDGANGQFLSSDGDGTFTWRAGSTTLQGLTDTNIPASITDRRLLEFEPSDGTWNATSISDILRISDMFDVHEDTPTDGQFLRYDADNSDGPGWVNTTVSIPANLSFTAPLSRSGNTVSVTTGGITNALLANDVVNDSKLNASNAGTAGQLLSADGDGTFTWVDADGNTAYTASEGLTLVSDDFQIAADGVTNDKLADNSVRTENIVDLMVTQGKIADGAIDTTQLANDAVTGSKIADNTITATQVAANSLGATELASNAVSSFKLQTDSVTTIKVIDEAITEPKLSITNAGTNGQVLSRAGSDFTWIDNGSGGGTTYTADGTTLTLTGTEFSITDGGVDTTQIATNAVTGTQINAGAVDTPELVDLAVETSKLSDGAVTNAKLGTGAVNTSKIFDGAVTTDKILDSNVTAGKLALNSVTTAKIADDAVTNAKLGTDIPISTLFDVDTTGVNNGQILVFNGTTWMPANNSGGGNTDNSRLAISLNETTLNEGDAARTLTATLSIANAETGETQSGQSVTVTDPLGHSVNVDGSGTAFTFSASGANVGNYVIRASATLTLQGAASGTVHTASVNLPVHATNTDWYQWVTDTQPTAITSTDVVDNGVFSSPETGTWTRPTEDTDSSEMAYVALPTGTYTFRLGLLFADIDDLGVISTNYTLYRINDFAEIVPGGDRIVTITEA